MNKTNPFSPTMSYNISISDKDKGSMVPKVPVQNTADNPLIVVEPCQDKASDNAKPQRISEQAPEEDEDDEYAALVAQLAIEIDNDMSAPPTSVPKVKTDSISELLTGPIIPVVPGAPTKGSPGSDPLRTPADRKEETQGKESSAPSTIPRSPGAEIQHLSSQSRSEIE